MYLLTKWYDSIPLVHQDSSNFWFWGIFRVLTRDLNFPEGELVLGHDFLEIAFLLCCDYLCKFWEQIMKLWSRFLWFLAHCSSCSQRSVPVLLHLLCLLVLSCGEQTLRRAPCSLWRSSSRSCARALRHRASARPCAQAPACSCCEVEHSSTSSSCSPVDSSNQPQVCLLAFDVCFVFVLGPRICVHIQQAAVPIVSQQPRWFSAWLWLVRS